jgi:hypothetical protein
VTAQRPVDEAVRDRLRNAIAAEDGGKEQLSGVLRMLGAEIPEENPILLFGTAPAAD